MYLSLDFRIINSFNVHFSNSQRDPLDEYLLSHLCYNVKVVASDSQRTEMKFVHFTTGKECTSFFFLLR